MTQCDPPPFEKSWLRPCFISHEAIEDGQVAEEAEVEEKEEYDTDYPTADNDEEDSLDDLMFLRAVTTRSGRMVRVVYRE